MLITLRKFESASCSKPVVLTTTFCRLIALFDSCAFKLVISNNANKDNLKAFLFGCKFYSLNKINNDNLYHNNLEINLSFINLI